MHKLLFCKALKICLQHGLEHITRHAQRLAQRHIGCRRAQGEEKVAIMIALTHVSFYLVVPADGRFVDFGFFRYDRGQEQPGVTGRLAERYVRKGLGNLFLYSLLQRLYKQNIFHNLPHRRGSVIEQKRRLVLICHRKIHGRIQHGKALLEGKAVIACVLCPEQQLIGILGIRSVGDRRLIVVVSTKLPERLLRPTHIHRIGGTIDGDNPRSRFQSMEVNTRLTLDNAVVQLDRIGLTVSERRSCQGNRHGRSGNRHRTAGNLQRIYLLVTAVQDANASRRLFHRRIPGDCQLGIRGHARLVL